MNNNLDSKEKIIDLYKFIFEFCKAKNKVITDDNKYLWKLRISDIPKDLDNIDVVYSDSFETDEDEEIFIDNPNYLLKVHKPEFQNCPLPPDNLKRWLYSGWDYFKNDVKIKEKITKSNRETNEVQTEFFEDDEDRQRLFNEWMDKRKKWVKKQFSINKTRDFFTMLYSKYNDLQKESESIEIIVTNGYIKDNNAVDICHPILTKRLSMSFDASSNTIYILNTNAKSELYMELFSKMDGINVDSLSKFNSDLNEHDYHPMDRNGTKDFLKMLVRSISSDSKFIEQDNRNDIINNRILMYFNPSIIIRKRLDGTANAIKQIIKNIEESDFVPQHLIDIVSGGSFVKIEPSEVSIEELLAKASGESIDILLTKEANKEQLEIAKRIQLYNAVLVQGPPGTGKTHTIANLIGHLLATGKNVLVTSYTKKALKVLKEKLPNSMQNLCVSILDDSNEDMEKSIDGITEYMSKFTSDELKKEIDNIGNKRLMIIEEASAVRKKIYNILNSEYKSIVLNGEEISPADASKFIYNNKGKIDYIKGDIELYKSLPLSIEELSYLYHTNELISNIEEKELNYKLPNPGDLITPERLKNLFYENNTYYNKIHEIENYKNWKINYERELVFNTNFGTFNLSSFNENSLNSLKEFLEKYKNISNWAVVACCDGKKGESYKNNWLLLIKKIQDTVKIQDFIMSNYFDKVVTEDIEQLAKNKELFCNLKGILLKRGKVNILDILKCNELKHIIDLKVVNNNVISTSEDCDFIISSIDLYNSRKELSIIWDRLMSINGCLKFYDLDLNEPEKVAEKYINGINEYLNWYENNFNKLLTLLGELKLPEQQILRINDLDKDIEQVRNIFFAIQNVLPYIVDVCFCYLNINRNMLEINSNIAILDDSSLINSSICIDLKNCIINNDLEKYSEKFKNLEHIYGKYELLHKRNELLNKIEQVAPTWASDIRNRNGVHGQNVCPNHIQEAWKYRQYELILNEMTKESISELQEKNEKLSAEYRLITEQYASKRAWYELLSRTEMDINMKQNLIGWERTVKKIGKGTGKSAPKFKAEARELMAKCQLAVPCWIMPMDKAIESLKPGVNNFDVIIIDEASQSDISALAIAYLGKKMIVIGDDKQVNPTAVGMEMSKINTLEQTYIKGKIPNSHLYTSKTSLYDIAATTFQPLMLKEHFRCVPEIIGFSNMLSYDYRIKPLRDSNSSNLLPAVINYRVDGERVNKSNEEEAKTIIALIKSCLTLDEYKGKTFGVISLLGDEQVRLIQTLLYKYVDAKDIEERKILIGNASNFQGDERDVIFLSMVDSKNEDGIPLTLMGNGQDDSTKKRYNVATSRAKDQLWVVNSLDSSKDLKPGDLRKKLLDYSTNPKAFELKKEEIEAKSDSIFEAQVANRLVSEGYHIIQQHPVGSYRLDIVVICGNKKVVIECDGDRYHSGEDKIREDMQRQAILERIGWKFIRIRGSQFFKDPDGEMQKVFAQLNNLIIFPEDLNDIKEVTSTELFNNVKLKASNYLAEITENEKIENEITETEKIENEITENDELGEIYIPDNEEPLFVS